MNRKQLVQALGEFLGVRPKYLSVPTFNYEIQTEEETYTVDKDGVITTSAGEVVTMEEIMQSQAIQPVEDIPVDEAQIEVPPLEELPEVEDNAPPSDTFALELPLEGHTGSTLQNLVNMLASKQHLIMQAFETDVPFMESTFAKDLSIKGIGDVDSFITAIQELGTTRCSGLTIDLGKETFTVKLEGAPLTPMRITAFQELMALVNQTAKRQKRASFKQSQDENPKYAFRTWLIRLGMNGDEYKETRKVLLQNLSGSGAYRTVGDQDE